MRNIHILLTAAANSEIESLICKNRNAKLFNFRVELGNVLKTQNNLGSRIKKCLDKEELIPSKLIEDLLKERFENTSDNILFVGFPRTVEQFTMLSNLTKPLEISERSIWFIQYDNSFETKFLTEKFGNNVIKKGKEQLEYFINELKKKPEFAKWKILEIDSEDSLFKEFK